MKRKHKKYSRPRKPFDKLRIEEEGKIKEDFGLKNKREIWKADSAVKTIREKAKRLISAKPEVQKAFFTRLNAVGFKVTSIPDVLSLDKTDYLQRRLQTLLVKKKIASTPKGARQLITHRKVLVNGSVIDSPSYLVPVNLEDKIQLRLSTKKPVAGEAKNEN